MTLTRFTSVLAGVAIAATTAQAQQTNTTGVPTVQGVEKQSPPVLTVGSCITGFVGDTTIAGGWTAFEAAAGKTMEVLNSGVADFTSITSLPSSNGPLTLAPAHEKRTVGASWGTWSHGYTGEVFWTVGATSTRITFPDGISAFDFYIEPNPFAIHTFTITGTCDNGETATIQVTANGSSGASHGGFYTDSGKNIVNVSMTGPVDWAIGELRIGKRSDGGLGEKYCQSNPNSCGAGASISAVDQGDGTFLLSASPVPNQPGIFFHALNQNRVPFGNGFLCATGDIVRLLPPQFPDAECGKASNKQNFADYAGMGKRNFQYWFRDPAAGGENFNTSNAISITFP